MDQSQSKLSIPVAIVIAGVVIAGAVVLTNYKPSAAPAKNVATTQQSAPEIKIPPLSAKDHFIGDKNAPLTLIEYSDTECPFCKNFHTTVETLMNSYGRDGKIAWVFRQFPLVQLHSKAPKESEATECANELGASDGSTFWKFIHEVFAVTPSNNGLDPAQLPKIAAGLGLSSTAFQSCIDSGRYTALVNQSVQDAIAAGGQGTPFTVIVSKTKISDATAASINTFSQQFPPGTVEISNDKLRVAVSGALPLLLMEQVIKILLGQS